MIDFKPGRNSASYQSMGHKVAAHIYTPSDFDPSTSYPAIVFTSPGTSIKEQIGANYGKALAKLGYVFLVFDRIGFGESEGPLKNVVAMHYATEATRDAISFLRTLNFVNRDRVFGLGICVGSQHIVHVAVTDKRLKAIATVSGMLDSFVWARDFMDAEQRHAYYLAANEERQKLFETGEIGYIDTVPETDISQLPDNSAVKLGLEYYKTPLGGAETFPGYSSMVPANTAEYELLNHLVAYGPYLETPCAIRSQLNK